MDRHSRSLAAVTAVLAVATTLLLGVASASASDASVVAAIKQAGMHIKETPELKADLKEIKSGKGKLSPQKAETLFKKFGADFDEAAKTVEAQEASTTNGKQGEKLWLAGAREAAVGFSDFAKAVEEAQSGKKSSAKSEALNAAEAVVKGEKDLLHGDKLLGMK